MTIAATPKKKRSFFREVQQELQKVTWTSKKELIVSAQAVILAIFFFGLAIYGCDLVIHGAINGLGKLVKMVVG